MTVLIDDAAIQTRVRELARELRARYEPGTPVHFIAVLKGAFMFLADLIRAMEGPVTCDFIAVSSYGVGKSSSGEVRLLKDLDRSIEGRDVVIVEDIVDTGLTLSYLQEILRAREPRSLRDGVPAEQTVPPEDRRARRVHRLYDRRSVRRRLRPGFRRAPSQPAVHRRAGESS